jgi:hypothetical protein
MRQLSIVGQAEGHARVSPATEAHSHASEGAAAARPTGPNESSGLGRHGSLVCVSPFQFCILLLESRSIWHVIGIVAQFRAEPPEWSPIPLGRLDVAEQRLYFFNGCSVDELGLAVHASA